MVAFKKIYVDIYKLMVSGARTGYIHTYMYIHTCTDIRTYMEAENADSAGLTQS